MRINFLISIGMEDIARGNRPSVRVTETTCTAPFDHAPARWGSAGCIELNDTDMFRWDIEIVVMQAIGPFTHRTHL